MNIKKKINKNKDVSYLNRDFQSLRGDLEQYAKTHFNDKIKDFSDTSLTGMFLDIAAYVGDVMSFYMDHQFNELNLETAVEEENLEKLIRGTGIDIVGDSPSVVLVAFTMIVDAIQNNQGEFKPNDSIIPIIKSGTVLSSTPGIEFTLLEDINMTAKDKNGDYIAELEIGNVDSNGNVINFILTKEAECTSAKTEEQLFSIGEFKSFRTIELDNTNVSEIISVIDTDLNEYYEVNSLTQDTVFVREKNTLPDYLSVPERIKMIPAPYRYEKFTNRSAGKTILRFGTGKEEIFDEDVIPDPSEFAVKLYGDRKSLNVVTIDPNRFLDSRTLGIGPKNTTLTVRYRYGGGINHNVSAGQINDFKSLVLKFNQNISSFIKTKIRANISVLNLRSARGGENEPTIEELRQIALIGQNSQGRIVSKEDMLARVYSLPNNFGRVFRASVRENPFNPFSTYLHVISRDSNGNLVQSSDTLKSNISIYLENFRLITDAIDIVDTKIVNIGFDYTVTVDEKFNAESIIQNINRKIRDYFDIKNFQIDQPVYLSEIQNLILNEVGVISLINTNITNLRGILNERIYSDIVFDQSVYTDRGIVYPPPGGIFEVKFPNDDIKGRIF